ncbi:MAG: DUF4235 domain-containing protein [Longimicrobiales bacterium]
MAVLPSIDELWNRDMIWRVTAAAAAVAGAFVLRKALEQGWKSTTGRAPPNNPASPLTSWPDAIAWTLAVGTVMGLGRLLGERGAASGWREVTGRLPTAMLTGQDR